MQLALPEILLILTIALLVFGPRRLPELGRTIGNGLRELRSALDGADPRTMLDPDPDRDRERDDPDDAELDRMIADDQVDALDEGEPDGDDWLDRPAASDGEEPSPDDAPRSGDGAPADPA